jgi:heterodisulfide reductase subunit B
MLPVFDALGIPLTELPDWNCCGATAYMSVDAQSAFLLALRNLALAERHPGVNGGPVDLVAPCAACYLALIKVQHRIAEHPEVARETAEDLAEAGLEYRGRVRVRHPLEVLVNDVGLAAIRSRASAPLHGLRVACYYGCQIVRPYPVFDDPVHPTTLDRLMEAVGAEPVAWPLKTRCCGGTLTGTLHEMGARLSVLLVEEADRRGASTLATACPLCQFNLECYQHKSGALATALPIVYFTQLVGLAFGIPAKQLGLGRHMIPLQPALVAAAGASHD